MCEKSIHDNVVFQNKILFPLKGGYTAYSGSQHKNNCPKPKGKCKSFKVETTWGPLAKIVYCTKLLKESLCT